VQEPRRMWKRYLTTNTAFAVIVAREALRHVLESNMRAVNDTRSLKG